MKLSVLGLTAGLVAGSTATLLLVNQPLVVNGKETADGATLVGGKLFLSADALRSGGAQVSQTDGKVQVNFAPLGGRNQVDAIEGTTGEWIQNDGWRIRVESVSECPNPYGKGPGLAMKVEMRNVHPRAISPFASGMDKLQIIDKEGAIVSFSQGKFKEFFTDVAPGGGFSTTIEFGDPTNKLASIGKPEKLLILFRKTGNTKLKDFRVFLAKE